MRIKSASFEPHRMRETLKKLEDLEKRVHQNLIEEKNNAPEPTRRPGLLTRWWRRLVKG